MSLHKSLKVSNSLTRRRQVLRRAERLELLNEQGRWTEGEGSVFGLPKVAPKEPVRGPARAKPAEAAAEDAPQGAPQGAAEAADEADSE